VARRHRERHRAERVGWLRAAVLGANDGVISTASLILGVASSHASHGSVLTAGTAALVAGAMSMAAGEYVSVHSQADTERAELQREHGELQENPHAEHRELKHIYIDRGLDADLAGHVAEQLMAHDALGAHARDELGLSEQTAAKPLQAALASAASFTFGAALPLAVVLLAPAGMLRSVIVASSVLFLALLGGVAARTGGAPVLPGALRVSFWGALAMAITAAVGSLFGAAP
jgi:VIT1/CCC1 family predicted Fe2+/Mn2+ transporter